MVKDLVWEFFEKTGNIEAFLEYNMLNNKGENNDTAEGEGVNNQRS